MGIRHVLFYVYVPTLKFKFNSSLLYNFQAVFLLSPAPLLQFIESTNACPKSIVACTESWWDSDVFYSNSVLAAYACTAVHAINGHRLALPVTAISDVLKESALLYMSLQTDRERHKITSSTIVATCTVTCTHDGHSTCTHTSHSMSWMERACALQALSACWYGMLIHCLYVSLTRYASTTNASAWHHASSNKHVMQACSSQSSCKVCWYKVQYRHSGSHLATHVHMSQLEILSSTPSNSLTCIHILKVSKIL
jgi:hypothetical protein